MTDLIIYSTNTFFNISLRFDTMMLRIVRELSINLLSNLQNIRTEAIIYAIGEIIRGLCNNKVR